MTSANADGASKRAAPNDRRPQLGGAGLPRAFGSRYVLLKEVAKGGMGRVFMALSRGRVCALKTLRDDEAEPLLVKRFLDEAKVVTQLDHSNLVFAFDCGSVGRDHFLAMEYIRGKSLHDTWRQCGHRKARLPFGLALFVVRELLRGLGYLHSREGMKIVHRDVALTNVMVSYEGAVKLIDFGIAKAAAATNQTVAGGGWGQRAYQSPEQLAGRSVDARSDIYSAGVILWELLTGRLLFPRDAEQPPRSIVEAPSRLVPELSDDIDDIVLTALAPDPADRYATADEFAAALTRNISAEHDGARMKEFMGRLFGDAIAAEAAEERELVARGAPLLAASEPRADASEQGPSSAAPSSGPPVTFDVGAADRRRRLVGAGAGAAALVVAGAAAVWLSARPPVAETAAQPAPRPAQPTETPAPRREPGAAAPPPQASPSPEAPGGARAASPAPPRAAASAAPAPNAPTPSARGRSARPVRNSRERVEALLEEAETLYQTRRNTEAMQAAREAVRLSRSLPAHLMLAKIYLQMERHTEAIEQYEAALAIDPADEQARKGRELAARRLR